MAITTKLTGGTKRLNFMARQLRSLALADIKEKFPPEVKELMQDGISPTRGVQWPVPYSARYIQEIQRGKYSGKTISPVNLKLTGKLYKSLKAKVRATEGTIVFEFKDPKAAKHDKGVRPLPKRQLFANKGQLLHPNLTLIITQSAKDALKKVAEIYSDR